MAYEALSNAGTSGEPLLVVLNDNNMSIAKNVGGLSRHLSRLRVSPRYLGAKVRIKEKLARIPGGRALTQSISRTKARIKGFLLPTSLFEQMGFTYLGPVDGHDLKSVCELLAQAKKMKKPVLLHVMTQKGRGYAPSENNPEKYHGVSQFDRVTGEFLAKKKEDFSARFGAELCGLADKDARICAITAAMPSGTGLTRFSTLHRDRFFDVGIAEEHAVAMAAGMAAQGLVPVVALYSTFLQRAYDQVVHDVAIEGLHVVFCIDRAGIVGADGATHNGVLDIAFLRSIPGVTILCPSSFAELRSMMTRAVYHENGPVAIRYPRGGEGAWRGDTSSQPLACVRQSSGSEVTLVTHGIMINETLAAEETAAQMNNPEANAAQPQPEGEFANFDDQAEFGKEQELRDRKIAEDSARPPDPDAILEVRHLKKYFTLKKTVLGKPLSELKAVDDVSFKIYPGETLGIVGESGCGKSTMGRAILKLHQPTAGQIFFKGEDIANYKQKEMRPLRTKMQIVFQDPYSSLPPRSTVGDILSEPVKVHKLVPK